MKNNELIERYVYAVTRRLPAKMRADIEKELNTLISDMLEERCGDMTPSETDVKVVLTELGTPAELASKYDPNGERSLIGPKYFPTYLRVLTITLISCAGGMFIAGVLAVFTGESTGTWIEIVCEWLANIWNTLLAVFAVITAVFAIMEYKKVDITAEDDIMKLPSVPADKEKISRADCIVGIVFGIFFLAIFLFAPQLFGAHVAHIGDVNKVELNPIFNVDYIHSVWYLFVISFGAEIIDNCCRLVIGRYNFKVAIISTITSVVNIIASGLILFNDKVMNPDFEPLFREALAADGGPTELAPLFANGIAAFIFVIILIINLATIAKAFIKAAIYRENN